MTLADAAREIVKLDLADPRVLGDLARLATIDYVVSSARAVLAAEELLKAMDEERKAGEEYLLTDTQEGRLEANRKMWATVDKETALRAALAGETVKDSLTVGEEERRG